MSLCVRCASFPSSPHACQALGDVACRCPTPNARRRTRALCSARLCSTAAPNGRPPLPRMPHPRPPLRLYLWPPSDRQHLRRGVRFRRCCCCCCCLAGAEYPAAPAASLTARCGRSRHAAPDCCHGAHAFVSAFQQQTQPLPFGARPRGGAGRSERPNFKAKQCRRRTRGVAAHSGAACIGSSSQANLPTCAVPGASVSTTSVDPTAARGGLEEQHPFGCHRHLVRHVHLLSALGSTAASAPCASLAALTNTSAQPL